MRDDLDLQIAAAVKAELGGTGDLRFPAPATATVRGHRTFERVRVSRRVAVVIAVCAVLAAAGIGVLVEAGSQTSAQAAVIHVGAWSATITQGAQAATDPTRAATIRSSALATYGRLASPYQSRGVYLGEKGAISSISEIPKATQVTFPSGSVFRVPGGATDVWIVEVGSASDPSNPAQQVNMLFDSSGKLLRAMPAQTPGLIGGISSLSVAQLGDLPWRDIPMLTEESPINCAAPGEVCGPEKRHPNARLQISVAPYDGGVVIQLHGTDMVPNAAYYLESGAGVVGSAKSSSSGALVAVMGIPSTAIGRAKTGDGNGIFKLTSQSFEDFVGCPFGGHLKLGSVYNSCAIN